MEPIVVAVDARTLSQTGKGVPRFLVETLRELATDPRLRLVLFSNKAFHADNQLPIETVIDRRWGRVPGTIWMAARLNRLASRAGARVLWGPAHTLPPRDSARRTVLTVHDLVYRLMPETMSRWNRLVSRVTVDQSIRSADRVVAVSRSTARDIVALVGRPEQEVDVIRLGVRAVAVAPSAARGAYLFVLGSIEPRKNIDGLLDCFAHLRSRLPGLTLRLTGAHSWGSSETLARLRNDPACTTLGFIDEARVRAEMAGARAFVMPSHYEGFGLPILEAVGLAPIIAADIPVFRELGERIEGICFVDFHDPERAAAAISDFLSGNPLPARFRPGAAEEFDWRTVANAYAELFLDLGGSRST